MPNTTARCCGRSTPTTRPTPSWRRCAPNWLALDPASGALRPATQFGAYAGEYSFDASRLPWRVEVDWLWFQGPKVRAALEGLALPERAYARDGKLAAAYGADGRPLVDYESRSMYAGAIGQLMFSLDRQLAQRVYTQHLAAAYQETPTAPTGATRQLLRSKLGLVCDRAGERQARQPVGGEE